MGLSRNKVAVSEGAAGSPPFYGELTTSNRMLCNSKVDTNQGRRDSSTRRLLFNFEGLSMIVNDHPEECFAFSASMFIVKSKNKHTNGGVAQLGEHLPCKQGVMGSNPIISTSGKHPQATDGI